MTVPSTSTLPLASSSSSSSSSSSPLPPSSSSNHNDAVPSTTTSRQPQLAASASSGSTSANFTHQPHYDAQLQHIAETDEIPNEYDWGELKEAIKFKIGVIIESFEENPKPWLHPAARDLQGQNVASDSPSSSQQLGQGQGQGQRGTNGRSVKGNGFGRMDDEEEQEDEEEKMNLDEEEGDQEQQQQQRASSSSSSSSSPSNGAWASNNLRNVNSQSTDADSDSDSDPGVVARFGTSANAPFAGEDTTLTSIDAIDRSGFYAAKTRPPPERYGSWGRRLTKEEVDEEVGMLFALLDEFESSPPFTIQRLCELLLSPKTYVRSAPKFLSSLTRILAITAAHSDFPPVSPGPPPLVSGHDFPGMGEGFGSSAGTALTHMPRDVGPPSPVSEPLFSPVPFIQRKIDDMKRRADEFIEAEEQGIDLNVVPHLDLEAETSAGAEAGLEEHSDEQDRSIPAAATTTSSTVSQPQPSNSNQPISLTAAEPQTAVQSPHISNLLSSSTGSTSSSSSSATSSQPLGVPKGRVDELDDVSSSSAPSSNAAASVGDGITSTLIDRSISNEDVRPTERDGTVEHRMDGLVHPISSTTSTPTTTAPAAPAGLTATAGNVGNAAAISSSSASSANAADGDSINIAQDPKTSSSSSSSSAVADKNDRMEGNAEEERGGEEESRSTKRLKSEEI